MTYHFKNRYVMTDDEGNVIQDREWNPDAKSKDAVQCPGCKSIFTDHWKDEECICGEPGKPSPERVPVQAVDCYNCSEYVLAHEFIDHVGDCLS
jgi:hypothetical protein